jgi:hypothetical protein
MNIGIGIDLGETQLSVINKGIAFYIALFGIICRGRRDWRLFVLRFFTGKAWYLSACLFGFWFVSQLEQPEWEEGEDIKVAERTWKCGLNFFQKVGDHAD